MPIRYKIDILAALKKAGYNTGTIRSEKLLSESTLQKLRQQESINFDSLARICRLLHCQPGDILEYIEESHDS